MTTNIRYQIKKEFEEKFSGGLYGNSESLKNFLDSVISLVQKETREEMKKELDPGLKELLPVMDVTHKWFKLHEEMGAEIVFVKREEDDGAIREIPVKAIYQSPLVKFQSITHS